MDTKSWNELAELMLAIDLSTLNLTLEKELTSPTFTPFIRLPSELRLQIWALAIPRRLIKMTRKIRPHRWKIFQTRPATPTLLQVCHESRTVALSHYKPLFGFYTSAPIYFNPKLDVLYVGGCLEYITVTNGERNSLWPAFFGHLRDVEHLMVRTEPLWRNYRHWKDALKYFPALKTILVADFGPAGCESDRVVFTMQGLMYHFTGQKASNPNMVIPRIGAAGHDGKSDPVYYFAPDKCGEQRAKLNDAKLLKAWWQIILEKMRLDSRERIRIEKAAKEWRKRNEKVLFNEKMRRLADQGIGYERHKFMKEWPYCYCCDYRDGILKH